LKQHSQLLTRLLKLNNISARIHHACLETHGMVVDYNGGDTLLSMLQLRERSRYRVMLLKRLVYLRLL
jgi:hypothetical protein